MTTKDKAGDGVMRTSLQHRTWTIRTARGLAVTSGKWRVDVWVSPQFDLEEIRVTGEPLEFELEADAAWGGIAAGRAYIDALESGGIR